MPDNRLARGRRLFEYHCWESENSSDAKLWHHTHQAVTVLGIAQPPEQGDPKMYAVRFTDDFEAHVFDDELVAAEADYYCEDYQKEAD